MLAKMCSITNEKMCLYLYKSLILPLFDYGDVIYDSLYQNDSEKLQKLENAALRIIYRQPRDTPIVELHSMGDIVRLENRRHTHVCHQMYKCTNDLAPDTICRLFSRPDQHHHFRTRYVTEGNLVIPQVRLQLCRRDFYLRGPFYYNLLDSSVREQDSLRKFKSALNRSNMFDWIQACSPFSSLYSELSNFSFIHSLLNFSKILWCFYWDGMTSHGYSGNVYVYCYTCIMWIKIR